LLGEILVTNETPVVFWGYDNAQTQLKFLDSIDPDYFRYLAKVHEGCLTGEDHLSAAIALRVTYSHALETVFAMIGAALQAPECPAGWLVSYGIPDLKSLVENISNRRPFLNKLGTEIVGWVGVANTLLPSPAENPEIDELRDASARLWKALARDMIDDVFVDEYNSLKHGLRVRSGEWFMAMGVEESYGVAPPPERMRVMASSQYGSDFLRTVKFSKYNKAFENQRVNWEPAVFAKRISLIADSISNVLSFLKYVNKSSSDYVDVALISQESVSEALEQQNLSSASRWFMRSIITPEMLPTATKEELLRKYSVIADPLDEPSK
jgi:hypothetical protein